jgi:hypothetical protein
LGQVEPSEPVRAIEHHHLPVVNRRNIGAGCVSAWKIDPGKGVIGVQF